MTNIKMRRVYCFQQKGDYAGVVRLSKHLPEEVIEHANNMITSRIAPDDKEVSDRLLIVKDYRDFSIVCNTLNHELTFCFSYDSDNNTANLLRCITGKRTETDKVIISKIFRRTTPTDGTPVN